MNEKILWKIESLIEKCTTASRSINVSAWNTPTSFFSMQDDFDPQYSQKPVMFDDAGEYYGMEKGVLLFRNKPVYIFDNHNKALFAFFETKANFGSALDVVHIDAHPDDATPSFQTPKDITLQNIHEVFDKSRICDFLEIAQTGNMIGDVQRVVTADEFENVTIPRQPFILSLDIDIFGPEGSYIDLEQKTRAIAQAWQQASVVTIATSPGFIDQEFGWNIIKFFINHMHTQHVI